MPDQEKTQEELIAAAKAEIESRRTAVSELCKNAGVPFWEGEFSNVSSTVSVFIIPPTTAFNEFKTQAFQSNPSAVFVEYLIVPERFEHTDVFEVFEGLRKSFKSFTHKDNDAAKDSEDAVKGLEERSRQLHEAIKGNPAGIRFRLFFGNNCIEYVPSGGLSHLLTADNIEYDLDSEDDDDEGEDDDDGFPDYSPEQLRQYALDLAMTMKIGVARNRDQRLDIATEFMQTTGVKMREYDVACVAQQGLNLYEVKVLPERVKKLEAEGKKAKAIAEELGCSLPKIRKMLAAE